MPLPQTGDQLLPGDRLAQALVQVAHLDQVRGGRGIVAPPPRGDEPLHLLHVEPDSIPGPALCRRPGHPDAQRCGPTPSRVLEHGGAVVGRAAGHGRLKRRQTAAVRRPEPGEFSLALVEVIFLAQRRCVPDAVLSQLMELSESPNASLCGTLPAVRPGPAGVSHRGTQNGPRQ